MVYFESDQVPFLSEWSIFVATMVSIPDVVSISYGAPEIYLNQDVLRVVDKNFQIMALRGTTVFASSGDDGASSSLSTSLNQSTAAESCNVGYMPQWPSSAPYVTAVGATQGPEADKRSGRLFKVLETGLSLAVAASLGGTMLPGTRKMPSIIISPLILSK